MPNEFVKILKRVGRNWFFLLIAVIIIVAFFNLTAAIVITIITIIMYGLSFIPTIIFDKKMKNKLSEYNSIDDKTFARKIKQPLAKVQKKMFEFSEKQSKKNSLIIFLNKQYIYYNEKTISAFKKLYNKGYGEKEILDNIQKIGIKTRAEIKSIEELLIKYNRLDKREVSVKEYRDKQRFNS